ncbi:MAG: metalloprotease PmbA, partial [Burkholderiaceae bacterium]|nr:metalloprotease PmbA [Burkholderiaceae bacterium]
WYTASTNPERLESPESVGRHAAGRALARLNARQVETQRCPVLFEAPLALGLMGAFVNAVSGGALYRKSSFLVDSLGTQIFPGHISLLEDPRIIGASASAPFDDEGVRTARREVVRDGIVNGYFLSSYSARRLGMKTTGNAGGAHNLFFRSSNTQKSDDFAAMLKKLDRGLLVTELMGQGVNYVTGDYSRGASGFWVENGVIQYPVQEITIAGNLKAMFAGVVAIGADVVSRGGRESGSVLIDAMAVAGN